MNKQYILFQSDILCLNEEKLAAHTSGLRFIASEYPFGIFKLFLSARYVFVIQISILNMVYLYSVERFNPFVARVSLVVYYINQGSWLMICCVWWIYHINLWSCENCSFLFKFQMNQLWYQINCGKLHVRKHVYVFIAQKRSVSSHV